MRIRTSAPGPSSAWLRASGIRIPLRAGAEALHRAFHQCAGGVQPLDAGGARELADVGVRLVRGLTELRHVTEDQPAAALKRGEHFDGGAHRARIGVVGVIDQPRTASRPLELQAPGDGTHRGEPRGDLRERGTGARSRSGRRERVGDVVRTAERKLDRHGPGGRVQAKACAEAPRIEGGVDLAGGEVGALAHPEGDHLRLRQAAPQRGERIVRVDDGGRGRCEPRDHLAFGARDTLEAAEAFEVLGAGVGDQPDGRTRHLDERRHLARVVGPHLHDRKAMLGSEAQQGERHADVVVEIAPRREGCADLA